MCRVATQIKYTEAILSDSTRKLLWFEISKMLIAVLTNKFIVSFIIIFGTLTFPTAVVKKDHFCLSVCLSACFVCAPAYLWNYVFNLCQIFVYVTYDDCVLVKQMNRTNRCCGNTVGVEVAAAPLRKSCMDGRNLFMRELRGDA